MVTVDVGMGVGPPNGAVPGWMNLLELGFPFQCLLQHEHVPEVEGPRTRFRFRNGFWYPFIPVLPLKDPWVHWFRFIIDMKQSSQSSRTLTSF